MIGVNEFEPFETFARNLANIETLNPDFLDWLMGWPIGWSEPERPVTEWSHWLRRSRGALSRLRI